MPSYSRQLYNINALYVSENATGAGAASVNQLHRIISFSDNFNLPIEGATQVGQLAEFTRQSIGTPTPGLTFDYYLHNGVNEERLGFNIDGGSSMLSGILNKSVDEKNYMILMVPEGNDAAGFALASDPTNVKTIGIGNGFITNWSLNASVGDFAQCSVSIEGLNYDIKTGYENITIPAVNPEDGALITDQYMTIPTGTTGVAGMPKIIKRGDITLDFSSMANLMGAKLDGAGSAHVQSISLDVPLSRTPLERLTSRYAFSREIDFPITASLSVEANVSDLNTGTLANLLGCGTNEYNFEAVFSACENNVTTPVFRIIVSGANLNQQSFQQAAGSAGRTATISFDIPVGGAQDSQHVIALSGSYAP